jgi:hypothetical protein
VIEVELRNGVETKDFLRKLERALVDRATASLFRTLGDVYVADVKQAHHQTQDEGRWAPASKWLKRQDRARASTFCKAWRNTSRRGSVQKQLAIVSTARGWSLTQHARSGFENKLTGPKDKMDGHVAASNSRSGMAVRSTSTPS